MFLYVQDAELPVEREGESGCQTLPHPLFYSVPTTTFCDTILHVMEQKLLVKGSISALSDLNSGI